MHRLARILPALLLAACAGRVGVQSPQGFYPPRDLAKRKPLTRPERTDFKETSSYADVMTFIDSLKSVSPHIYVTTLGKSPQGKTLPLVIMSRPMVKTPAEAKRLGRPIVYVQGNIHGGEVEGKEAALALMRDLELDEYKNVADSLVILWAPIYNADGNDAFGPQVRTRGSQNGPESVGQRANGQNLDLNRDYIKAEAPETKASLKLFNEWDPDVLIDLHTTDGSYHGYRLTWAPPLNPAARFTGPFTRDTILPILADMLRRNRRIETFPYGNFVGPDSAPRGWITYDHRVRYGTNYYGVRGRIAILSEAYSHDDFRTRIASTYGFVHDLLSMLAANAEDVLEAAREADRKTTAFTSTGSGTTLIPIRSKFSATPPMAEVLVEEVIRTPGDTMHYEAGMRQGSRRTGKVRAVKMPVIDRFESSLDQTLPYAWAFSAAQEPLVAQLRMHGVFVEQLAERSVLTARSFAIDTVVVGGGGQGNAQEISLLGRWNGADTVGLDAGTYIVRAAQPLGILSLLLLEPQSDDGFVTWHFVDQWIKPDKPYPILRVTERFTAPLRPVRDN